MGECDSSSAVVVARALEGPPQMGRGVALAVNKLGRLHHPPVPESTFSQLPASSSATLILHSTHRTNLPQLCKVARSIFASISVPD